MHVNREVWLAPALLHYSDRRIAEKHYDLARDAQAVTIWQQHVHDQRKAARARDRVAGKREGR